MEKNTALDNLTEAAANVMQADAAQTNAAISAREAGASWEEIGTHLGITKQRAHQRYNEATRNNRAERQAAAEARGKAKAEEILEEITTKVWKTTNKETPKTVDQDRAGNSVTPSIFLDPIAAPATAKKRAPKRTPGTVPEPEPLPEYSSTISWSDDQDPNQWRQDNPKHFLATIKKLRGDRCTYCGGKTHRLPNGGTWIYEGCTPTTTDPIYYTGDTK